MTEPLLTRKEAAARLGVSLRTFASMIDAGFPVVRPWGRLVRVRPEDIDAWVALYTPGNCESPEESDPTTASDSGTGRGRSSDPRVRALAQELLVPPRGSTLRQSRRGPSLRVVDGGRTSKRLRRSSPNG